MSGTQGSKMRPSKSVPAMRKLAENDEKRPLMKRFKSLGQINATDHKALRKEILLTPFIAVAGLCLPPRLASSCCCARRPG